MNRKLSDLDRLSIMFIFVKQQFTFASVLIFELEKGNFLSLMEFFLNVVVVWGFFLRQSGVCVFNFITTVLTSLIVL